MRFFMTPFTKITEVMVVIKLKNGKAIPVTSREGP
jgi:hypothetical protein